MAGENPNTFSDANCDLKHFDPGKLHRAIEQGIGEIEYNEILGSTRSNCDALQQDVLEGISSMGRLEYLRHYRDLSRSQQMQINAIIASVNGDLKKLSNDIIFNQFTKPDKTLSGGVEVRTIGTTRIVRSTDLQNLTIEDLYQIPSRDGENNMGGFLILGEDGFIPSSPDAIKESILTNDQLQADMVTNIVIGKLVPGSGLLRGGVQLLGSSSIRNKANKYNVLFGR